MATIATEVPGAARTGGFPSQASNQADAVGQRSAKELAQRVADTHQRALSARRYRDLTSEKYILHIDGEGDNQWADILRGSRVAIPRQGLSEYRTQENLLRPIVDNAVAYHTAMPFRFATNTRHDRESRERGLIDQAWANHLATEQHLNDLAAQALYMAVAGGFCPLHAYWRDDLSSDPYEPVWATGAEGLQPGIVDCWVGNPFDTTFNRGAKRGSVQSTIYGRVLPADLVRRAFSAELDRQGVTLEGTDHLPSASVFQRLARNWYFSSLNSHGTPTILGGEETDEELIAVLCEEVPPGIDARNPDGRLTLVALQGTADTRSEWGRGGGPGEGILLADMPLPARRFSWSLIYSHHRFDDVHGKPWVSDLDDLQVQLNLSRTKRKEYIIRQLNAPTITSGPLTEDMAEYDGYTILELEPTQHAFQPRVMEIPVGPLNALNEEIADIRQQMYTIGGYQAASRGESHAGDAAAKVVALQRADDTIHGPVNRVFRSSITDFMSLCWQLTKDNDDAGHFINIVGDDLAHLVDGYIDKTKLSQHPPTFRLTSLAGATPESHAQQIMTMVTTAGADGMPLMTTEEARKQWPDQNLFGQIEDARSVQRRRAREVAATIRQSASEVRRQSGVQGVSIMDPQVMAAARPLAMLIQQEFPLFPDDDPAAFVETLTEITQDETEDPIARLVAMHHQAQYRQWIQSIQMQQAQMQMAEATGSEPRRIGGGQPQEAQGQQGGLRETVNELTAAATG